MSIKNFDKPNIALIGKGFVGEAFYEGMKDHYNINVWDTDPSKANTHSLGEAVELQRFVFVSVPTPMNLKTGECDTSILESVIEEISKYNGRAIIIVRSTVPPGTCAKFNELAVKAYDGYASQQRRPTVVFNPEFLTEANYINDFKNQTRIVLGGFQQDTAKVAQIYNKVFPTVPVVFTDITTAECVKYFANCFLATKVTFANEMKQIVDAVGVDYNTVAKIAALDPRIGSSHITVPGPDGHLGFGGTCFPKDINALMAHAKKLGVPTPFLESVWKKNLKLRPERDWEADKGRAVTL
jgi:UDPglucose 6-dehydrogenase